METTHRTHQALCPYPDCAIHEQTSSYRSARLLHVADQVFLCAECGRLSYKCVTQNCDELNRPFSLCCRKCGTCQFLQSGKQLTAADRWDFVEQFDYDWEFRRDDRSHPGGVSQHEVAASHAATVTTLGELDTPNLTGTFDSVQTASENPVLLECRFIDGLLAVHQGGGFVILLHPFADLAESRQSEAIVWHETEGHLLDKTGGRLPQVEFEPLWFRPYTPQMTRDRRFALFSTPYLFAALDLLSLPGWSAGEEPHCEPIIAFDENDPVRLAAAPVPLTVQPWPHHQTGCAELKLTPNQIGLLLKHTGGSYWWCVLKLDGFFGNNSTDARKELRQCVQHALEHGRDHSSEAIAAARLSPRETENGSAKCVPLPVKGEMAQVNWFREQRLVFATPAGHWLWSLEEAQSGAVTPSGSRSGLWELRDDSSGNLKLDCHVSDRKKFAWPMQCLFSSRRDTVEKFEIAYTSDDNRAKTRDVRVHMREGTEDPLPIPSIEGCRGLLAWAPPDGENRELLFVAGREGALYKRKNTQREPIRLWDLQIGAVNEVFGLTFRDPLMVLVCENSDSRDTYDVRLRSLRFPIDVAIAHGVRLWADPIAWSNFLFTCEADHAQLCLRRHEFAITSHRTNRHMNNRTSLASSETVTPPKPVQQQPFVLGD